MQIFSKRTSSPLRVLFLKNKINLSVYCIIIVAIIPALALVFYSLVSLRSVAEEEVLRSLQNLSASMAEFQREKTGQAKSMLQILSECADVKNLSSESGSRLLKTIVANNQALHNIILVGLDGNVIASARESSFQYNFSDRLSFVSARENNRFSAGEFDVSKVRQRPVISFGYPVSNESNVIIAILMLAYDLEQYGVFLQSVKLMPGVRMGIFDRNGFRVFGHSWNSEEMAIGVPTSQVNMDYMNKTDANEGHFISMGSDGAKRVVYFTKLYLDDDNPYMYVVAGYPLDRIDEFAGKQFKTNLDLLAIIALLLGASFLAIGVAGLLGKHFVFNVFKEIAESEKNQRALFDNSLDAIMIIDKDGNIVRANPSAISLLNCDHVKRPYALETFLLGADFHYLLEKAAERNVFEVEARDSCGRAFMSEAVVSKYYIDNELFVGVFLRDIESRKIIEAELVKAREQAIAANKTKSLFLANISHEIRTPMNAILGLTDLIKRNVSPESNVLYAAQAHSSGMHLLAIINDLLDISRIEAGRFVLSIETFDLHEAINSAFASLSMKAEAKKLNYISVIDSNVPALMEGDPGKLRQVLINLLSNAIKFTNTGTVILTATLLAHSNPPLLRCTIKDDGIGIPGNKLEQIFEPFTQADYKTHAIYGGTGLGLSLSKKIIEMMNGEVWVESTEGLGSIFSFSIPCYSSEVKAA